MSKSARTDEIDALVSSVRDFVSHKDQPRTPIERFAERLVLTPEQRVSESTQEEADSLGNTAKSGAPDGQNVHAFDRDADNSAPGLEDTLSALEEAMANTTDDWAPDEVDLPAPRTTPLSAFRTEPNDSEQAFAEQAADALQAPPVSENPPIGDHVEQGDAEDASDDLDNVLAPSAPTTMAEDALRAMITEIVHEELSGELGERMTRNIRKLVRREINRVLASRELDKD